MTSEPDSTPRRRPPTIDLTATEVDAEKPAAAQTGARPPGRDDAASKQSPKPAAGRTRDRPSKRRSPGSRPALRHDRRDRRRALVRGYLPPRSRYFAERAAAEQRGDCRNLGTAEQNRRRHCDPTKARPPPPQPDPALASRLAAAEAATKSLGDSLAALTRRVDELRRRRKMRWRRPRARRLRPMRRKSAAQTGVARSDLDALAARIAALESAVKTLADDVKHETATADDRAARLTVAAEALRATVERGAPYQAELAAAKSLGADQSATAPLEAFAAAGVPSAAALAHELASLMPALQQRPSRRRAIAHSSAGSRATRSASSASRRSMRRRATIRPRW